VIETTRFRPTGPVDLFAMETTSIEDVRDRVAAREAWPSMHVACRRARSAHSRSRLLPDHVAADDLASVVDRQRPEITEIAPDQMPVGS